jgi:RNA polymerase sigma factor (sigma-70 family)
LTWDRSIKHDYVGTTTEEQEIYDAIILVAKGMLNGSPGCVSLDDLVQSGVEGWLKSTGFKEGQSSYVKWCAFAARREIIEELRRLGRARYRDGKKVHGNRGELHSHEGIDILLDATQSEKPNEVEQDVLESEFPRLISELPERHQEVITAGLDGTYDKAFLKRKSKEYGLSQCRVSQLKSEARDMLAKHFR